MRATLPVRFLGRLDPGQASRRVDVVRRPSTPAAATRPRSVGCVAAALVAVVASLAPLPAAQAGERPLGAGAPVVYRSPALPLQVVRRFDPPASPYGPGHRGVDLRVDASLLVHAAASGTVSFAGQVAGRGVVVIAHPDGIRTEYEPVTPLVRAGATVAGGAAIGRLDGTDAGCGVPDCLHWGARRGEDYIDPLSLLEPLGPVRLLPWHGLPAG